MQEKKGREDLVSLDRTWSGPVHGGLEARLKMVDLSAPTPVTALHETWQVTVYDVGGASRPVRMFDLVTTQTCATAGVATVATPRVPATSTEVWRKWRPPPKRCQD